MTVHPYIPNSVPEVKREMLKGLGLSDAEELFKTIPEKIKFKKNLNLPHSTPESETRRHVESLLRKNKDSSERMDDVDCQRTICERSLVTGKNQ